MIIIDSREDSAVVKAFDKNNIPYAIETLNVGDFIDPVKNICIEHKTITDFIGSFRSGHLMKQLLQMQENYKNTFLILNGSWKNVAAFSQVQITVAQMIGMLSSVAVRYSVKMVCVDNNSQLAQLVKSLCEKVDDGKVVDYRQTELLKNKVNVEDIKIRILTAFDGIGIKKSTKILETKPEIKQKIEELIFIMN